MTPLDAARRQAEEALAAWETSVTSIPHTVILHRMPRLLRALLAALDADRGEAEAVLRRIEAQETAVDGMEYSKDKADAVAWARHLSDLIRETIRECEGCDAEMRVVKALGRLAREAEVDE